MTWWAWAIIGYILLAVIIIGLLYMRPRIEDDEHESYWRK